MTASVRKALVPAVLSLVISGLLWVVVMAHVAWGDERYVLKEEARLEQIAEIDVQLAVKDTEILFAANEREKEKLRAIKAIYERKKQALKAESRD